MHRLHDHDAEDPAASSASLPQRHLATPRATIARRRESRIDYRAHLRALRHALIMVKFLPWPSLAVLAAAAVVSLLAVASNFRTRPIYLLPHALTR